MPKAHKRSRRDPRRVKDPIPVGPVREKVLEAMEAQGFSWSDLVVWVGWEDSRGKPDTTRLKRRLGLQPESPARKPNGYVYGGTTAEFISAPIAASILRAAGVAPVEVRCPVSGEALL